VGFFDPPSLAVAVPTTDSSANDNGELKYTLIILGLLGLNIVLSLMVIDLGVVW
jgi:hypothetical protein